MDAQKLSLAITKALAYTENGGKPSISGEKAGKSGEVKSLFQFLPATWKKYSQQITGQNNLTLTPENEALVAHGIVSEQVQKGLQAGKNPDEIATEVGSLWNSGNPEGAKEGLIGTNKSGVKYNVPAYAKKVVAYTNQFLEDTNTPTPPESGEDLATAIPKIQNFVSHIQQVNPQAISPTSNPLGNVAEAPQLQNAQLSQQLQRTTSGLLG